MTTPTNKQTLKQTLQQIAAAEILGWNKYSPGDFNPTPRWQYKTSGLIRTKEELPNFHTDANASIQLIEWMKEKGFACYTQSDILGKHHCHFTNGENGYESKDEDSFPLAILNAFLSANGREDLL